MARFNIYSSDGQTVRYKGAPKYNGIFGKPSYIEFAEIASPTPIAWSVGDYVDYTRTGFRYRLYSEPQVVKSATSTKAGDAFVYKNVQFFARTKDLEIALFRDVVLYDNSVHFSSLAAVDTYEDVYGIARRIQANMDAFAPNAWNIQVVTTTDTDLLAVLSEVKQFSVSDGTCLDALNAIYNTWSGIGWVYSVVSGVNTITIGRPNIQDSGNTVSEFSYGHGNGLKVLTRNLSSKSEMATRIYAYGSDRNMPTRYYNNYTPAIKDHESVYIPHLMLPLTDWGSTGGQKDARLAYLEDATAISKYGLIPKVLRFDGSGDNEEIYPSVTGMTIGDVTDSTYPSTGYSTSERIDVLKAVTNPDDDGQYTEGGEKVKYSIDLTHSALSTSVTTKAKQEYVTLGASTPLASSGSTSLPAGKYVIKMDAVHGTVSDANDYLASVPKAYMEVYVGSDLKASVSKDVIVPRMDDEFYVDFGDVTFTADTGGVLKIYWRIEISLTPVSSAVTISYAVPAAAIPVSVEYSIGDTFTVKLKQIGFDINDMGGVLSDGLCTLSMRSGMCAGRDFVVIKCEYNSTNNDWVLTCRRQNDTSLMLYFPNTTYPLAAGDQFVLVDLQMPDKYVTAAMTRLHDAASKALARLSKPLRVYTPEIDSKEVLLSEVTLLEGLYMPVYDTDLISATGNTEWVLIDSVTIAENESPIPIWSATLRDEKPESMLQKLTGELNASNRRLRDLDMDASRQTVRPAGETGIEDGLVGVTIEAEATIFPPSDTAQTITLTAKTSGLNSPTYQWYYLGASTWEALTGETKQAYIVQSNSVVYFQNGEIVEDFKVTVTDGFTGASYSDTVQITKLVSSGVTIALSNPVHLFAGEVSTATDNQTDSTGVVAYNGTTRIVATINSVSGQVTGLTTSIRANTNGTTAPIVDISVTDDLVTPNGELTINVTAGGITRDLTYSWAIAFKGEGSGSAGLSNAMVYLYQRASSAPSIDWQTTLTYSFVNKALTSVPSGWSQAIPAHTGDPLYVTAATASSRSDTDDIEYTEWATPVMLAEDGADGTNGTNGTDGTNGLNSASVFLYQRAASTPSKPSGTFVYTFATGVLSAASGSSLGNWTQTIPNGSNPCYVTQATAVSRDSTDTISGSEFSTVKKLVEDGAPGQNGTNGTNGADGDSVEVQWSQDGSTNWHSNYQSGDLYMRQRIGSSGSWGDAIRVVGEDGDTIYTSFVFKASDTKPSAPEGTSPIPSGWYDAPPSETETTLVPTYDSNFVTSGTPHLDSISHSQSIWGKASFSANAGDVVKVTIRASSENNYDWGYLSVLDDDSHSTDSSHYVAKISGTNTATREFTITTAGTHFFCVGYTKDASQSSNNDTIYVDSVVIVTEPRVWMSSSLVTNGVSDGNWSDPIEITGKQGPQGTQGIPGQDGLMGKIMRGINEWSQYGLGTSSSPVNYEGRSSTDPTHIYYDVVYHDNNGTKVYYYCENEEYNGHPARYYEPNVTTGWANCWVEATHYDFIATKVLLADNAFIDVMSGNAIYMYGTGALSGTVVAGMQGGTGINLFAGDSTPANAPFRVDYEGNLFASQGDIGPYTIGTMGLVKKSGTYSSRECQYSLNEFNIELTSGQTHRYVKGNVAPSTGVGVLDVYSNYSNPAITTTGDILRNSESVVSASDTSATKDPILHIVHCTQTEYNNLSTYDSNTMYVIE